MSIVGVPIAKLKALLDIIPYTLSNNNLINTFSVIAI